MLLNDYKKERCVTVGSYILIAYCTTVSFLLETELTN